ncbi:ABC transporter ATP-binding protein [Atopobacter phocae]|uniref:ABC transporter ATP-binding protein n=1 Tax=Atopobacter phocae TaxID=136492 RepID=UPI0004725E16|nr:ABC transporter ATP-binding protein [Atopobacter phocae]
MDKQSKQSFFKRLIFELKPYLWHLLFAFILTICSVGLSLYMPLKIGQAIDQLIGMKQVAYEPLFYHLKIIGVIILLTAISDYLTNIIYNQIVFSVTQSIRTRAIQKIAQLPVKIIDNRGYGSYVSTLITDVEQITDGLLLVFTQLFRGILIIILTIGFMFSTNVYLALAVLALTPSSITFARYISRATHGYFSKTGDIRSQQMNLVEEVFSEQLTVRANHYETTAYHQFQTINEALEENWGQATFLSSVAMPVTRFINGVIYAIIALLGALLAIKRMVTVGQLTAFLAYANQYTKPFNDISSVMSEFQNTVACFERVFELIDLPEEIDDGGKQLISPIKGAVSFEQVSFSYSEKPVIKNISFDILPGQSVAIVGTTGSGKTTLINLLMRFYEINQGRITIDGQNIQSLKRESLHQAVGMVLQETWLKNGTIKENLMLGASNATEKDIISVTQAIEADGFINQLPHGYDTIIGENGTNLSEGQRQLLTIARLMLSNPPILILDEATSSIDTRTERHIQRAIDQLTRNRTSIVIAHRLSTIQRADVILVLDQGKLVEYGNHNDLIRQQGQYYKLYQSQFKKN